jgi:hypothetical protein
MNNANKVIKTKHDLRSSLLNEIEKHSQVLELRDVLSVLGGIGYRLGREANTEEEDMLQEKF